MVYVKVFGSLLSSFLQRDLRLGRLVGFRFKRHSQMTNCCTNNFAYLSWLYGFTNYLEILDFLLSSFLPEPVSTYQILFSQEQHFWKYRAQKIVEHLVQQSFSLICFQFCPNTGAPVFHMICPNTGAPVFHMIWKIQESLEPWLVGFWLNRHLKIQKLITTFLFFGFFCVFELPL